MNHQNFRQLLWSSLLVGLSWHDATGKAERMVEINSGDSLYILLV